jgi:hypothetical protein
MDEIFNLKEFHISTTRELKSVENRVRNLIGRSNWGEEGRYKEAILRNIIRRFISPRYTVGTGFIVKSMNQEMKCSSQIDILIFDSNFPILFSEGEFYIVTPNSVKAVIEVKTNLRIQDLEIAVETLNNVGILLDENQLLNKPPFIGIFSFNGNYHLDRLDTRITTKIKDGIGNTCFINHISLNKDIFIKHWPLEEKLSVYNIKNLSFSFFISNLIHYVTDEHIENESLTWFPDDKESKKLFDINLR